MDTTFMQKVEKDFIKRDPDIRPGDTVVVHLRITEAGRERVQQFEGVVISVKGSGLSKMITVRKISNGVGVEKILPVNSPMIKKIDVKTRGNVRRSKLYYMRDKVGKRSLDVTLDEHFEEMLEEDDVVTDSTENDDSLSAQTEGDTLRTEKEEEEKSGVSEETEEKDSKITEGSKDPAGKVAEHAEEQKKKDVQPKREEASEKDEKADKKEDSGKKSEK